ncbi:PREDICTED: AAA-ATPase At3g50940-like [Ipomoea nil]|uniref:AAA-ATPase At3g50940-like n=1 Tax=Ipomoea nil TaxID=35883 RepID=UPI000901F1B1|nr:PREDICTED: AAA-ATPase At3g50940-like [Ipomoea nil]
MADLHETSNMKTVVTTVASLAATAMLVRSVAGDLLPEEFRHFFSHSLRRIKRRFSTEFTIVIDEFRGNFINQVFHAAGIYLGSLELDHSVTKRVRLGKTQNDKSLIITMDNNEEIVDSYENIQLKWRFLCIKQDSNSSSLRSEVRMYELSFHKKHKARVVKSYLPYILERSNAIKAKLKETRFHSNLRGGFHPNMRGWNSGSIIQHPMTFNTLAMDERVKSGLIEDLDDFVKGKEYYRRMGRAWKRGYLLYGPPGTGKSSLIAAMSNYLNYDIYDLDLSEVNSNSDLRPLLFGMGSRSILVIEDIDCTIKLENRNTGEDKENRHNKVTLSGLLNFLDGIWSCCGEERIIVVTTNHIDRLDPALLRPGRMDMHIHLSYCKFSAFKQLAVNYLGIYDHQLFPEIEGLLEEVEVTPAEVAGELMIKSKDTYLSLQGLIQFLHNKKNGKGIKA